jgi:hypothetical protein
VAPGFNWGLKYTSAPCLSQAFESVLPMDFLPSHEKEKEEIIIWVP